MKNQEDIKIQYSDCNYKYSNFLKNGDFITFTLNSSTSKYPVIFIYSLSNQNEWTYKTIYEFNIKDIKFGDVINDKMWMLLNNLIYSIY